MRYYKNHSEKWWKGVGIFLTVASVVYGLRFIIGMFIIDNILIKIFSYVFSFYLLGLIATGVNLYALSCAKKAELRLEKLPKPLKYNYFFIYFLITFLIGIVSVVLSWYALESDFTARLVLTVLSGVISLICLICAVIFFIKKRRALYMEY